MPAEFVTGPDEGHDEPDPRPALRNAEAKRRKSKVPQRTKPMRYVSLHHHSTFSYLDGYRMPEAHVRRAAELGMTSLALTEHGNISSHVKLEMAALETGIKPIYGCEVYTGQVGEGGTQRKNHLTLLSMDQPGYQNLLRMVTQGWSDYYYEPTVSGKTMLEFNKGLIALSGCTGSLLSTTLIGGKNVDPKDASYKKGREVAARFKKMMGDRYYLEVQAFPELPDVCKLNKMMAQLSEDLKIPLVASGDVHYTTPEESEIQQILHNVRGGSRQTLEQQSQSWGYDVPLAPAATDRVMLDRLVATGLTRAQATQAILNTEEIAQRCNVELPKMPMVRFPTPAGFNDTADVWHTWLREGWKFRGFGKLKGAELRRYKAQLKKEMEIIEAKDYVDYFLIVSDIVKYAKDSGIPVGPARGSAAASIVCYLLRITEVNPMLFPNLVFERFIDVTREDLPDIDLDFDSDLRIKVKEYAEFKYGRDKVANIGTFTYFKSKNSLDDVARVYRIPQYEVDKVKEVLVERSSGDLRASATIEETRELFEQAGDVFDRYPDLAKSMDLEGNVKGMGVHAAGLVISNAPISDVTAVYRRKVKDVWHEVVGIDKYDAERQGLLKIDVLGLSTMSTIRVALELLDMELNDLYSIPLDDPATAEGFRNNETVGIFQFDGRAMRTITESLKPDDFKEVCDINALARPGPLHSGATGKYIDVKWGRQQAVPLHPMLEDITHDTHHQIVYQEQILRIVREVGNFPWTHAAHIRKIISKKLGEQEFERQYQPFAEGAAKNGVSPEDARNIWNHCITAGTYAFNAAHCVSYGLLAWWTMWLKQHHPREFYISALRTLPGEKHIEILKDAHRQGIKAVPPHPTLSGVSWNPGVKDDEMLGGFQQVKGIGPKIAPAFVEYAAEHNPTQWSEFQNIRGVGQKKIETIMEFCEKDDPYDIFWLKNRIQGVIDECEDLGVPKPTHSSLEIPYEAGTDQLVRWAGVVTARNQKDLFEMHFSRTGEELDPNEVEDAHLRESVVMWAKDDDDFVTCRVTRWRYGQFRRAIWGINLDKDVVVFEGLKKGWESRRSIDVRKMWVINPDA